MTDMIYQGFMYGLGAAAFIVAACFVLFIAVIILYFITGGEDA